jgi:hypothetical protein
VAKGPDGMLLRTPVGTVRIETPLNLAPGSQVVVRVTGADARLTATVISVDGRPPGGPAPQAVLSAPPAAPATAVQPAAVTSVPPAPATINPPLPPPAIARLTTGSRVAGTIAIDRASGVMVLQSRQGTIRLDGPRGLTVGSRVVLEVDTVAPRLVATLVSVDNRPPAGVARSVVLTPAPAAPPPAQASVTPGSQITATVVQAAPARVTPTPLGGVSGGVSGGATATSSSAVATPPGTHATPRPVMPPLGTSMTVTIRTIAVPGGAPAGAITVPSAPAPTTSPAAAPVPGAGPSPMRAVSPGAATTPPATLGSVTVVGQDASGRTLAKFPGGLLRLAVPAPLPAGTTLTLDLVAVAPSPPTPLALGPAAAAAPWPGFPEDWGTLRQSLDVIAATDPEAARGVLDKAIPNTRPSSSANLIALLLGLRMGNLRTWMGDRALSVLESAGRTDLTR